MSLCFKHPVLLENSIEEIKPRFFQHAENRLLFKALKEMIELNKPIDEFTLNIHLKQLDDSDLWKDLIAELKLIKVNEEDFNSYILYIKNRFINEMLFQILHYIYNNWVNVLQLICVSNFFQYKALYAFHKAFFQFLILGILDVP